jgi:hypothetical protein
MKSRRFPFSLIINDGIAFKNMPLGELLVYGDHDQAIAQCDYEGNLDRIHPDADAANNELERWVMISNNRHSVLAWHGERKPQYDHFDNGRRLGKVSWTKALRIKKAKADRRKRKKNNQQ